MVNISPSTESSSPLVEDSFLTQINNYSERLDTCDSVYKLAIQTQKVRERERKEKINLYHKKIKDIKKNLDLYERKIGGKSLSMQDLVKEEISNYIKTLMPIEFKRLNDSNEDKENQLKHDFKTSIEQQEDKYSQIFQKLIASNPEDFEIRQMINQIRMNNSTLRNF